MSGKSSVRLIADNTAVQAIGNILGRAIDLVVFLVLAQYLNQENMGVYIYLITYFTFWGILTDAGTYAILVREGAKQENTDRLLGNAFSIGLAMSVAAIVLSNLYLILDGHPTELLQPALIASLTLIVSPRLNAFRKLFQVQFHAHLKMGYVVLWSALSYLLLAGLISAVLLNSGSLSAIFTAQIAAETLSCIGLISAHRRLFRLPKIRFEWPIIHDLFRQGTPLMLGTICATVYDKIGILMLESMKGQSDVAFYGFAAKLPDSLPFVATILVTSVYPVMVKYQKVDQVAFERIYARTIRYLHLFIVPVAGFCTLVPELLLSFFFPNRIPDAAMSATARALIILVWAQTFRYAYTAFSFLIIAIGREKLQLVCIGVSAICGIVLNLMLIPTYGIVGSAIAVIVGAAVFPGTGLFFPPLRKYAFIVFTAAFKPLLATLFMALCVHFAKDQFLLAGMVAIISYGAAIFLLKGISREDLALLKQLRTGVA